MADRLYISSDETNTERIRLAYSFTCRTQWAAVTAVAFNLTSDLPAGKFCRVHVGVSLSGADSFDKCKSHPQITQIIQIKKDIKRVDSINSLFIHPLNQ